MYIASKVKGNKYILGVEDVWGNEGIAPPFLTSALDGGGCLAGRLCRLTPGETASGIHCVGGLVGPRVCVDVI
jgi:hypothetical protein